MCYVATPQFERQIGHFDYAVGSKGVNQELQVQNSRTVGFQFEIHTVDVQVFDADFVFEYYGKYAYVGMDLVYRGQAVPVQVGYVYAFEREV